MADWQGSLASAQMGLFGKVQECLAQLGTATKSGPDILEQPSGCQSMAIADL